MRSWRASSESSGAGSNSRMSSGDSRLGIRSDPGLAALDDGLDLAEGGRPVDREREAFLGAHGELVVDEEVLVLGADRDRDPRASEDLRLVEGADQGRVLEGVRGHADVEAPRACLVRVQRGWAEQVVAGRVL